MRKTFFRAGSRRKAIFRGSGLYCDALPFIKCFGMLCDVFQTRRVYLWPLSPTTLFFAPHRPLSPPPPLAFAAEKKRKSATIAADRRKHPALALCASCHRTNGVCAGVSWCELVCVGVCEDLTLWLPSNPPVSLCLCVCALGFDIICAASWQIFVTAALNWILTFLCMHIETGDHHLCPLENPNPPPSGALRAGKFYLKSIW